MRIPLAMAIAAALAAFAIESSGQAFAASPGVARDHRAAPTRVIRTGRLYDKTPTRKQVIVNGKRVPRKVEGGAVVSATPRKVIRAGRLYDKTPTRKQVIVNGKRVPRRV